jgi:hypothetical protein
MNAVERRIKKSPEKQTGPKVDIRKNPHVIYVDLKVYSPHKSQSFILTET